MNKVLYSGNLVADPQQSVMPSGTSVTNFVVACDYTWKDKQGVDHKSTQFYRTSVTNRQADACAKYLYAGRKVVVEGHLLYDQYGNPNTFTTSEGHVRAKFDVRAHTVEFGQHTDAYLVAKYGRPQQQAQPVAAAAPVAARVPAQQDSEYIPF